MLYTTKMIRPDIETVVGFLCTSATKKYKYNWKKLRRVIAWMKGTIYDIRII